MNEENARTHTTAGVITLVVLASAVVFTTMVFPVVYNWLWGN